jgi:hypothetical protein
MADDFDEQVAQSVRGLLKPNLRPDNLEMSLVRLFGEPPELF